MAFCCWPWLGVMLAAVTTLTTAGCGLRGEPTKAVVVDSETHCFGPRPQGEELSHTFVVANQMDVSVKIVKAVSSCGCMVADRLFRASTVYCSSVTPPGL